jgi:hypothetical protein
MVSLETNVFPIRNLEKLSAKYRLYRIKGLRPDQGEYYQNRQYVTNSLSRQHKSPILALQRDDETYLVIRDDVVNLPEQYDLIRHRVQFELASDLLDLDFTLRNPENDEICARFLQFAAQEVLYRSPTLWQPGTGKPFFEYEPINVDNTIDQYRGYSIRVTATQSGGLGIAVDVTSKLIGHSPLSACLNRKDFEYWKYKHFIYHFGQRWYEVQAVALDDRTCGEYEFKVGDEWINLLDYTIREAQKPISRDLAQVTRQDSVILYRDSRDLEKAAISSLCYPIFGTDADEEAANFHRDTILPPHVRRRLIHSFMKNHLLNLKYGATEFGVSLAPESTDVQMINIPDQRFGQGTVLSVVGTENAQQVSLDHLGSTRKALLQDPNAGFFTRTPLDRQYFVIPASVMQSYGEVFLDDLKRQVEGFYPQGGGYNPIVIKYDDRGQRTFVAQGKAILQAIQDQQAQPGYAVVMVHSTSDRKYRQEDPLSGMITSELRDRFDIAAAVIHTDVSSGSYQEHRSNNGSSYYQLSSDPKKRGKFIGYLRNVAVNKVLLTNQKWPFMLEKRLCADVTIGIDVKQHTAGFVVAGEGGRSIRTLIRTSRQKERLLQDQIRDYLLEVLRQEIASQTEMIKTIVIHRDGRTFQSEIDGAYDALTALKRDGSLDSDATITILEIPKNSLVRLRLFDVSSKNGRTWVENPQVGCYYIVNDVDAYLCTTGRTFPHDGTTRPLHIRRIFGTLSIHECLKDVYALSTLAWTKPDDCSRYPITLKLCDRYLAEDATDYDADALARAEISEEYEASSDE